MVGYDRRFFLFTGRMADLGRARADAGEPARAADSEFVEVIPEEFVDHGAMPRTTEDKPTRSRWLGRHMINSLRVRVLGKTGEPNKIFQP